MTAVDFTAFVDGLAEASGEEILPFFRTNLPSIIKAWAPSTP